MTDLPDPLVPRETDVRDLDSFLLNVERVMASELLALASNEEIGAAFLLWCRAWKQLPAASLPDDERILAAYSRLSLTKFRRCRETIMRGFVKCSDGRFYHSTLAATAADAYAKKRKFQERRETDAERLRKWRQSKQETPDETHSETHSETRFVAVDKGEVRERKGKEVESPSLRSGDPPERANLPAKPDPPPRKRASSEIPDAFPGNEEIEKAVDYWKKNGRKDINAERQAELFRAHHQRSASRFVDWGAAWRTWYVRALDFSKPGAPASGGNDSVFDLYGT